MSLRYMLDTRDLRSSGSPEITIQRRSRGSGDIDDRFDGTSARRGKVSEADRKPSCPADFASRLEVLSFDWRASQHAADIKNDLERQGQVIGAYDLLIAGHARGQWLAIVTGNFGELRRVAGLVCEDWMSEQHIDKQYASRRSTPY